MNKKTVIALCITLTLLLAGCQGTAPSAAPEGTAAQTTQVASGEVRTLNIFTWEDYFPRAILQKFEKEHNVRINFSNFSENEEMLAKLQAAGGGDYDIVLASDYIIDIARKDGLMQELDVAKIPNFGNINPTYQSFFYDPDGTYTVPYTAGTPLIVYDPEVVDFEIEGYEDLWNPALVDSIAIIDTYRVAIGITLKTLGYSFNTTDVAQLEEAKAKLFALKPNIRIFDNDRPQDRLLQGEVAVAFMFTPQVVLALEGNPDLRVVYPKEGMGFGVDACFIPAKAPNADVAHEFLNFILDGEISAQISMDEKYINCNSAATPFLSEEYLNNRALYIPQDQLGATEFIQDVGDSTPIYDAMWTAFKNLN